MSSAPRRRKASLATRTWLTLGGRLALWYVAVTLASYLALAAVLPFIVKAYAEKEAARSAAGRLDRYRSVLDNGGTDALRALFDCHDDAQASVAVRLSDERNVELFRASSDETSARLATALTSTGAGRMASKPTPRGWNVAGVHVSQGRVLEILLHDESALRAWERAREASLLLILIGLASAIIGAFVITRRALRPLGDLARTTQRILDSRDLALRVPVRGTNDSLDQLGVSFNEVIARNESLVRAMRESLDNVAHDLRTPLTRLRAGAELALREKGDVEGAREALAETIEESDRVLGFLTTLTDISEAEAGAMRLDTKPEDLAEIAREAIDLYEFVSAERGVRIVTRLSPGVMVSVDRARIRQVAANLLDNAIKYTSSGGQVDLTVRSDGGFGVLSVADTGVGIEAGDLPRVWDRLFRGDTSRAERGLGLGLSLVKAVVQAHGGTVIVESAVGRGSTFEVRLRRAT